MSAARHVALARQREELRRERDRMLLDLADELGAAGMAQALGLEERHANGLLRSARERLDASSGEIVARRGAQITVRRLRSTEAVRVSGTPKRSRAPEPRRPVEAGGSGSRVAGSPTSRSGGDGGAPAAAESDRWALADAHYEALGRLSLGAEEEQR
jgi:hypothetical protein